MKSDLRGPNVTQFDVLNATDYITPALEILDTRILRADPETAQPETFTTPFPTTPPMPALSRVVDLSGRTKLTCAGSAPSCLEMQRSLKQALAPRC